MTTSTNKSYFSTIKQRIWLSLPLVPVFSGMAFLIAICSPLAWGHKGFIALVGVLAISLGILCAYCTVVFIQEFF
ncbi:MAG: hypothetical protein H7Z18_09260 [Methylophilaceae bacterium]|nr:hypothetical protein [Methylophilaceae bacterium]